MKGKLPMRWRVLFDVMLIAWIAFILGVAWCVFLGVRWVLS